VSDAVAVVGAGLAGLGAVRALRGQGYLGRVVLIGQEPHAPYDRPPLSKEFLAGTMPFGALSLAAPQDAELEVDVRTSARAVALHAAEREVELDSGELVGGDGVVLATGARARALPASHGRRRPLIGVHTLRTVEDAIALREALGPGARLVVVGAGFIGAEVASTARGLGVEVTVVEVAPVPLEAALGEQLGAVCGALHAEHGVRLLTGVGVEELLDDEAGRVRGIQLADGRQLAADAVLVAVGSMPNVEWLAGSGLQIDGGVYTDAAGATAIPGVVATGDCTRRFEPATARYERQEHWTNALQHPQVAVATLLGGPPPARQSTASLPYFWSDQYDRRLQFAGHRRPGDTVEVVEGSLADPSFVAVYRRQGAAVAVLAMNNPRVFGKWRRELAAALPVPAP
jgi:3-phenylpropionate/trans-cinnamate dioxygenase ferredoxin reductase subunit